MDQAIFKKYILESQSSVQKSPNTPFVPDYPRCQEARTSRKNSILMAMDSMGFMKKTLTSAA